MRAVEQSAGGKLFHHVVESDKVAAGILKEFQTHAEASCWKLNWKRCK